MRGGISQLSGLICEELLFTWLGKFYICQGKVRQFQKPLAVAAMIPFGAAHNCMVYIRREPSGQIYCRSSFFIYYHESLFFSNERHSVSSVL